MSTVNNYKTCFVPQCTNTTIKTPEKLFFHMPKKANVMKAWFKAARRADTPNATTHYYCCEDHFTVSYFLFRSIYFISEYAISFLVYVTHW